MKIGEVYTFVTIMGEVVGRLKEETEHGYAVESPRLFVPAPDSSAGGFAPGLSMTGKQNIDQAWLNKGVVLTVVPTHHDVEAGWISATSGIVV